MTASTIAATTATATVPSIEVLRAAVGDIAHHAATLSDHDVRWQIVGPLVSTAAARCRVLLGSPALPVADAPPVVRQRDLAVAARGLLRLPSTPDHPEAALDLLALSEKITLAVT